MTLPEMLPAIFYRFPSFSPFIPSNSITTNNLLSVPFSRRISSSSRPRPRLRAGQREGEPQESELDKNRAREALRKLDQQLQSLATEEQQVQLPKTSRPSSPYSEPTLERDVITGMRSTEEMPEFSRSYLSYSAVALLLLTLFTNIIFNFVVKPSIDGKEEVSLIERVPLKEP